MSQMLSVRTNNRFLADYANNQLISQVEIVVLIENPYYEIKAQKIVRKSELSELRFETDAEGLTSLIGQLEQVKANLVKYDKLEGVINNVIINSKSEETATK